MGPRGGRDQLLPGPRRDAGPGRRVGLRQDQHRADHPADGELHVGKHPAERHRHHQAAGAADAPAAPQAADDLPGPVRVPGSPVPRPGCRGRADAGARYRRVPRRAPGPGHQRPGTGRAGPGRAVPGAPPARAVRRPAAAGHDRRGSGAGPGPAARRRARLDAGRVGPGRRAFAAGWAAPGRGHGHPHDHPRPVHGRALRRPYRGHVPGPDRGAGPGAGCGPQPAASLHPGAAVRGAPSRSPPAQHAADPPG